jgi:hypothetical protein
MSVGHIYFCVHRMCGILSLRPQREKKMRLTQLDIVSRSKRRRVGPKILSKGIQHDENY